MSGELTVTVTLEIQVDERAWKQTYGLDEYAGDWAEAQRLGTLVADVEDYAVQTLAESRAAEEGAIVGVELMHPPRLRRRPEP